VFALRLWYFASLRKTYAAKPAAVAVLKGFFLFTAFLGLNLFQSGLTNWCLMSTILRKLGVKDVTTGSSIQTA